VTTREQKRARLLLADLLSVITQDSRTDAKKPLSSKFVLLRNRKLVLLFFSQQG
jgi:hypothetical protein